MLTDLIQKIIGINKQCSPRDVKITSEEKCKKNIAFEKPKENTKLVEELTLKQIYEDILFIS